MPYKIPLHVPARMRARPRDESARPNAHQRGYCDNAHKAWRLAVLTRDAWQCQDCGRVCADKREAHADHVVTSCREEPATTWPTGGACA